MSEEDLAATEQEEAAPGDGAPGDGAPGDGTLDGAARLGEAKEAVPGGREPTGDFAARLQRARLRAGVSQSQLARRVGIDASYLNRIERAEREPPRREIVEALVAALGLPAGEADELLVAAGHLPRALAMLGPLDPTIRLVAEALADEGIPAAERAALRQALALVVPRFAYAQSGQASRRGSLVLGQDG